MTEALVLHATCVAVDGRGVLITGPSGSGKSGLGLALMALGARLVADDRVTLSVGEGALWATCPPAIRGMIEARGLGLLAAEAVDRVAVALAVDLETPETERLPPWRTAVYLGRTVPLVRGGAGPHFPAALLHYVRAGRKE